MSLPEGEGCFSRKRNYMQIVEKKTLGRERVERYCEKIGEAFTFTLNFLLKILSSPRGRGIKG